MDDKTQTLFQNNSKKYRIANWNLERPLKFTKKLQLALNRLKEINPDICILTETSSLGDLGKEYNVSNTEMYEHLPNDQWAAIWSKWPIKKEIPTFDSKRTTCVLIQAPFGDIIIYATVIPYRDAGVRVNGKYADTTKTYKSWEMHKENIVFQSEDWLKITNDYPGIPLCVAGDFNQTRDKKKGGYGNDDIRMLLSNKLEICGLSCITEENFEDSGKLK